MTPLGKKNIFVIVVVIFLGILLSHFFIQGPKTNDKTVQIAKAIDKALIDLKSKDPLVNKVLSEKSRLTTKQRLLPIPTPPYQSSDCDRGHWIDKVLHDGKIIILEDDSIWEVDLSDVVESSLWLPTSEILICDDKLINIDDREEVTATKLR